MTGKAQVLLFLWPTRQILSPAHPSSGTLPLLVG